MGAPPKSGKFNCDKCTYSCCTKATLQRHTKQAHEGITGLKVYQKKRSQTTFQCEECNSTYHTKSKLIKHKKTDHLGEKKEEGVINSPPLSPEHKKIKEDKVTETREPEDNNEELSTIQEEDEDEVLVERLRLLREDSVNEDRKVLDSMVNKTMDEAKDEIDRLNDERNKIIKETSERETIQAQEIRKLSEAKTILTNHITRLKDELSVQVEKNTNILAELKARKDNQEEWTRYGRKYKMKTKILEMKLRKETRKNE